MSYNETHFGKLVKLDNPNGLTIEELCKEICNKAGITELEEDNWADQLNECESLHKSYFIYKNSEIYQVFDKEMNRDDGYIISEKLDDSTIEYKCQFYNGGAYFYGEVLTAIVKSSNN